MTIFALDVYIEVRSVRQTTIIDLRGIEDIGYALQYFIWGVIANYLLNVRQILDKWVCWLDEPVSWLRIGNTWSGIYAKEIVRETWPKLLKAT